MSDYSHGTAFHQKLVGSIFHENMMTLFSCIYAGIYKLVTLYCNDCVDDSGFGHEEKPFVKGNVSVRLSGLQLHGKCRLWVFISSDGRQDNE